MQMFVCPVQIISGLDDQSKLQMFTVFSDRHIWCTTDVHQYGGSILGSVNLCKTFRRISEVWDNAQT